MKRNITLALSAVLTLSLCACGGPDAAETPPAQTQSNSPVVTQEPQPSQTSSEIPSEDPAELPSEPETTPEPDEPEMPLEPAEEPSSQSSDEPLPSESPSEPSAEDEQISSYIGNLIILYYNHEMPDGSPADVDSDTIGENEFAVYDVDGDGSQELIIYCTTGTMAGMTGSVWDYKDGQMHQELLAFPALSFYDNGMVQADWSHNQGKGDVIWPYTLLCYDAASDTYEGVTMVDSWNKELVPDGFPNEADLDGDGNVFYLMEWGNYDLADPIDNEAYEEWYASQLGGAQRLDIPFQKLTPENIEAIK